MTPDHWRRLEEIYHAARNLSAGERASYLDEACRGNDELRREIESLLVNGEVLSKLEARVTSSSAQTALSTSVMVGPYRIEERLDAGGMGVVYRALDTRLDRQVAIKIGLEQFSDRFHREARTVAALNHVNVCTLHDIGSTPDIPGYLVMEFVEGPTLAKLLEDGAMRIPQALQIARQMAAGLAAAHARGIVHRDLKPGNVKITPQGVVKVLDFGLAKDFPGTGKEQTDPTLTAAGTVLGTAAYMSPEQAAGKDADSRSDIFSFGIVLYEMLCGRRPFRGNSTADVIASVLKTEPEPPRRSRADIPAPLEHILLKCLQKNPESRYASGAELQRDLDAFLKISEARRGLSLRSAAAAVAIMIVLVGGYYGWRAFRRNSDLRWLEQTAVPEIAKLIQQDRALEALSLYRKAERIDPNSKLLYKLAEGVASVPVKFETTPPGATIYVTDYAAAADDDLSQWQRVGVAPVTLAEIPNWGYYRLRAVKDGFAPADQVFVPSDTADRHDLKNVRVILQPSSVVPPGMVWVPDTPRTVTQPPVSLPGFWMDRYEVTNRQFQEFVNAGGYRKPEYWKEPFLKDGRPLSWEQAISEFHDLTGRAGPANWSLGAPPENMADFPVAGVSWYEAMAYAEFAGKALPTVYEWRYAAPIEFNSDVALMSNFDGKGPTKIGMHRGMTTFGAYDMAGNVKEWTFTYLGRLKFSMGGAWDESPYTFGLSDANDPFLRTISLGFRCVKRPTPPPAASFAEWHPPGSDAPPRETPVDDKTYRIFSDLHQYQASPLDARVEHTDSSSPYWTRETVSFRAAYGNDRMLAHLFLPKNVVQPYQVVVVFGGSTIMQMKRVEDFGYPYEFLIRSGRAVLIPAFWGTLERGPSEMFGLAANEERDRSLKLYWDLARSLDYLKTRQDIDSSKLAFFGISWGACHAPRLLALETRFKAAALLSGGFLLGQPREVDAWNFAPRYRVPTLMLNGKQDYLLPYETNQKPFFELLGTPAADKRLVLYEGGHRNPVTRPDLLGEILAWFDHYLGPIQEKTISE